MKLELGSGKNKREGFVGIDLIDFSDRYKKEEFIQQDLEKGIPIEDNKVEELFTQDTLEHLSNTIFIMEEIWRVCKNKAKVTIIVPFGWIAFHQDPTHKSAFTDRTFNYFTEDYDYNFYTHARFKIKSIKGRLIRLHWELPQFFIKLSYFLPLICTGIKVELEVIKDE